MVLAKTSLRIMTSYEDKILENILNEYRIAFSIKNLFGGGKCKYE